MGGNGFPSMGSNQFKRLLRKRLGYEEVPDSGSGSHSWLESEDYPRIRWAFHDSREISSIEIRKILVNQVGLSLDEARRLMQ